MKKLWKFLLIIPVLIVLAGNVSVANSENTNKVYKDGDLIHYDVQPIYKNGRIMVPIRKTEEGLFTQVLWSQKDKKVTIKNQATSVQFYIGKKNIIIDGKKKSIDEAPIIYQSRTMVPIRFLATAFGYKVRWDPKSTSVIISTKESEIFPQDQIEIPILMYHHFDPKFTSSTTILPKDFEKHLQYLKANGYETINDLDLVAFMDGRKRLPAKSILISMDDGYESNYKYAFPLLKKYNMKATISVIVSRIREDTADPSKGGTKLSWDQAKEMYDSGLVEIQSHTYNLHDKGKTKSESMAAVITQPVYINNHLESQAGYRKRVLDDLRFSKRIIENKIGNKVVTLTYPYGAFSNSSEDLVKEAGFRMSTTINPGLNKRSHGAFKLYRINVPPNTSGKQLQKKIDSYK